MQYLQRKNKPSSKAHIWNQQKKDTSCRMWLTGGLGKDKNYEIVDDTKREICTMCENNLNKQVRNKDEVNHKNIESEFNIEIDQHIKDSNCSISLGVKEHYLIGVDKKGRELFLHGGCLLIVETRTVG